MTRLKVLVVDDSAIARGYLRRVIDAQPDMQVVGLAADAAGAFALIDEVAPEVVTLDVEMPGTGGLEFLARLMRERPLPVVMVSGLTAGGSQATLRALELGAVDFIAKRGTDRNSAPAFEAELVDKIRTAARARLRGSPASHTAAVLPQPLGEGITPACGKVILLGASTGGTEALKEVLGRLPVQSPAVLITQHMPESFTPSFAERLDQLAALRVHEARHEEPIRPGNAYLAPGHSHMLVRQAGQGYVVELSRSEPVNRHRPSVDVLFSSAARVLGEKAVAALLTGMGKDGATGLLELRRAGAHTIAQDEATSVVYGMPKAAVAIGAAIEVVPLPQIAARLIAAAR